MGGAAPSSTLAAGRYPVSASARIFESSVAGVPAGQTPCRHPYSKLRAKPKRWPNRVVHSPNWGSPYPVRYRSAMPPMGGVSLRPRRNHGKQIKRAGGSAGGGDEG